MDRIIIYSVIIGVCLLLFIGLILYGRHHKPSKGEIGEKEVSKKLNKYISRYGGYLINDVIIPGNNDKTSEIDHIVFSIRGVFVIETKNISGTIYGREDEGHWTQVLGEKKDIKNDLYNPVMQNQTHVDRLNKLLNISNSINVVVFNQNNTKHVKSKKVIKKNKIIKYLKKYKENVYYDEEVKTMYEKIKYYVDHPIVSKKEHIENIEENYHKE